MLNKEQAMDIKIFDLAYRQLEEEFMKYSALGLPLYCVIDSIVQMMQSEEVTFFILPRAKSKDGQNHYFYFNVVGCFYEYRGCDLEFDNHLTNIKV
ncbi:DUF5960 family protein [Facklamia miroungae]|uniref:Uncharacterized protein n=1 Tax=Facklamia miroungae TaxID=120956 RepID=A0A1G7UZR7_9LACT|nr:DUF5960 family protein [Facklamia miroungae]NKZ30219.1 hypothetical protein [Facklamia miroungae]SDG53115.1 hypothetical protein SAMN05421791_11325 [Facklamia miroungae]